MQPFSTLVVICLKHNTGLESFYLHLIVIIQMVDYSYDEKTILVQYAIKKFENEEQVLDNLQSVLSEKDIQRIIDTLIGTQRVRRIGPEIIQNNESHTELPELPDNLKPVIDQL